MMEEINLDKYKSAWKSEESFLEEKLSRERIVKFMQSASKNISGLFRKSLIIDIAIKLALTVSFGVLLYLYAGQYRILGIPAVFILITLLCIVFQIKVLKKIPDVNNTDQNLKSLLYSYIDFYTGKFVPSLILTSLSGSLLFISGALYYFYYNYGTIRSLQYDDYLVFGTIIVVSFLLSAFIQIKNFRFHIRQLENSLNEIELGTISESKLKHYEKLNKRNLILYSVIVFVGLLLLVLLLFRQ